MKAWKGLPKCKRYELVYGTISFFLENKGKSYTIGELVDELIEPKFRIRGRRVAQRVVDNILTIEEMVTELRGMPLLEIREDGEKRYGIPLEYPWEEYLENPKRFRETLEKNELRYVKKYGVSPVDDILD